MAVSDSASEHLKKAWMACFGRKPDPDVAYDSAIKAVEAAAKPIVSPTNPKATLGTMLGELDAKAEKWSCALGPSVEGQVKRVRETCALLWKGQKDIRHGADGKVERATQDAAEGAVLLAVALVGLFRNAVKRTDG